MNNNQDFSVPQEPPLKIFLRFLRFGVLAWGGPVTQIAMIRQELVAEERWITSERFNRVLAVYQVLPGPEAHELCVYFGMLAGKRWGGFLAGLGFMLPGFLLMFLLSWLYVSFGMTSPTIGAIFLGCQPAVTALIVRAVHHIGAHAVTNLWLWSIALLAALATSANIHFLITLSVCGVLYMFVGKGKSPFAVVVAALFIVSIVAVWFNVVPLSPPATETAISAQISSPSLLTLFWSGLRTALLTFGGAYTAIPYLQYDAVVVGQWMTNAQFLDGLAISGLIPAPLIIFSTFVGYIGGGFWGALVMTVGVFFPPFAFTLIGHQHIERLIENKSLHSFLDGVTAGVIGLIAVTAIQLFQIAVTSWFALGIFILSLTVLYIEKSKYTIAFVVIVAGVLGLLLF